MIAHVASTIERTLGNDLQEIKAAKTAFDRAAQRHEKACADLLRAFEALRQASADVENNLMAVATAASAMQETARPFLEAARDLSPEAKDIAEQITSALQRIAQGEAA